MAVADIITKVEGEGINCQCITSTLVVDDTTRGLVITRRDIKPRGKYRYIV